MIRVEVPLLALYFVALVPVLAGWAWLTRRVLRRVDRMLGSAAKEDQRG